MHTYFSLVSTGYVCTEKDNGGMKYEQSKFY